MVYPRESRIAADTEPFFPQEFSSLPCPGRGAISWSEPSTEQLPDGGYRVTRSGRLVALEDGSVQVRLVVRNGRARRFRWTIEWGGSLRFEGIAKSESEVFVMVDFAATSLRQCAQRIRKFRGRYREPLVHTPEETRAFSAIELLIGTRPVYQPIGGKRAWVIRDDDIPENRKEDWKRHGHSICSMLRDLTP